MASGVKKRDRQTQLRDKIRENPFLSDEELANMFEVSIQTIRLDRLALAIPELRERTKSVAERTYGIVKSMGSKEIVGELIDITLGERGISILETTDDMVFERSQVVRGQFIFAQAESLAIALIDADVVLTGLANVKFKRPVTVGEKLVAKGEVIRRRGPHYVVLVETKSGLDKVFRGKFSVFVVDPGRVAGGNQ
ncbi:MAG TPA: transcription factor FapR [Symbiobacteriaceae bacterium]|nr:transcription factor FapR [Symbiobacteriaceae bacterium]